MCIDTPILFVLRYSGGILIKCKNLGCSIYIVEDLYEYSSFDDKYHPFQNVQRMITIFMLTTKAISVCKIPRCIFKKKMYILSRRR